MSNAEDAELRRLRARAYGPDADTLDATLLARLHALERPVAVPAPPVGEAPGHADPVRGAVAGGAQVSSTDGPSAVQAAIVDRQSRRGVRLLWAGSLFTVCIVAVAAVLLTSRATAPLAPGVHQVAQLSIDPEATNPGFFATFNVSQTDVVAFEEYAGLTVIVTSPDDDTGDDTCLYIYDAGAVDASSNGLTGGRVFTGCAAGRFPPVVQFIVTSNLSAAVLATTSAGDALQFIYDRNTRKVGVLRASP